MSTTHTQSPHVTVLGAGVVGLTSAVALRQAGYKVRILSKSRTPNTTSDVAAAFWYPFHIEGPRDLLQRCAESTYEVLADLVGTPAAGITMLAGHEFFETDLAEGHIGEIYWWKAIHQVGFRNLRSSEIPNAYPFRCGFEFTVPVVHMPTYLRYLEERFTAGGDGVIISQEIQQGDLADLQAGCDLLVNCTGLGSRTLFRDEKMFPIQGQIMCISPRSHWNTLVFITQGDLAPLYIVPRGKHDIVLGGTTRDDKWGENPERDVAQDIVQRCAKVYPEFGQMDLDDPSIKHRVGLRPARHESVRIEAEVIAGKSVIHCYGHGGGGVTLSWGSAAEVVRLAKSVLGS